MNSTIKTFCLLYSIERSKAIKVRDDFSYNPGSNEGAVDEQTANDFEENNTVNAMENNANNLIIQGIPILSALVIPVPIAES